MRCKFWDECSYAHRQFDEQPSKKSTTNGDKIGLRIPGYGAAEVFIDFAEELKHTEANPMCSNHHSRVTSRQHSGPKTIARTDLPR